MDIFYENEKIMLSYGGNSTEVDQHVYRLCPDISDGDIGGLHLVTADRDDPQIHMVPYGWDDFSLEPSTSVNSASIVKLDPEDLYKTFVNEDAYCFLYDQNQEMVIYR
jgi:hypothetical protein